MRFYFVPCWSGDFRLERDPDDESGCLLTVENPTAADKARLGPFLEDARNRGWLDPSLGIAPTGKSLLKITTLMEHAGPVLAENVIPIGRAWTVIRSVKDEITFMEGIPTPAKLTEIPIPGNENKPEEPANDPVPAVAAVSVPQPVRGCPFPTSCQRRASEVLRTFSTERQWEQFQRRGYLTAYGNVTGMAYNIFHRDEAAYRGLHRSVAEASTGRIICAWNNDVPPEEEVLTLKFAMEHREGWVRQMYAS